MPTKEVVRDAPRAPLAPIDESVVLPASVLAAQKQAETLHAQAYETPEENSPQPDPEPQENSPRPEPVADGALTPPPPKPPAPPVAEPEPDPNEQNISADQWKHRYLSMQGRYHSAQRTIGDLQEQMTQLGDELVRTQQASARPAGGREIAPVTPAPKLLTPEDESNYGPELIDFATRAAKQAIAPELEAIKQENQQLKKTVTQSAQNRALATLGEAIPNWRAINHSAEFKTWLRSRDVYSSRVRHELLNEAHAAANAPRMIAFFKGFLAEAQATGQIDPQTPLEQPQPVPRQAAIPLERLAAPGKAKPAAGNSSVPADKPVITRAQISKFYANVRAGHYVGRDAEKAADEAIIFAAQADGRVR
jgi:hypothetical protein